MVAGEIHGGKDDRNALSAKVPASRHAGGVVVHSAHSDITREVKVARQCFFKPARNASNFGYRTRLCARAIALFSPKSLM